MFFDGKIRIGFTRRRDIIHINSIRRIFIMKNRLIGLIAAAAIFSMFAICADGQTKPDPKPQPPGQTPPPPPVEPAVPACPKIDVRSATQPIRDGVPVKFNVSVAGGDGKVAPVFSWTISAGVITAGQGTNTIDVDSTGAGAAKEIVANLLIGGFPPECSAEGMTTVTIAGPAQKLDEYGTIKDEEETARLDRFFAVFTPKEQALVIVYAGRTSARGHANTDLKKIRAYLLKAGMPSDHLATMDGGFREQAAHELWLVPIGAEAPRPAPTINAKDIVYPKPTPPVKKP